MNVILALFFMTLSCRSSQERYFIRNSIPKGTAVAILVEGGNEIKNAVFMEFLKAGYTVKAINASDFYRIEDVLEVKDLKKTKFVTSVLDRKSAEGTATVAEKFFDNLYKLHLYNFETAKAEILTELKKKYKVDYIILLSMKTWDNGYSWVRAIQIDSFDLVYIHNYPSRRTDNVQSILSRFIEVMQKGINQS
ncbi:MAG: hypothetical protein NZ521_11500 [Flammeovirgaceae bacterium]|nr:hypothetical protein [Flammeovirgaceae bacterium]